MTGFTRTARGRPLALLAALTLAAGMTACSDSTGPEPTPVGTWTLVSISGSPLPFVLIQVGLDKLEVTAGRITINQDGTCSFSLTLRSTESGNVTTATETDVCTWTRNNNAMTFSYQDGTTASGSLSGDTLTLTTQSIIWAFER